MHSFIDIEQDYLAEQSINRYLYFTGEDQLQLPPPQIDDQMPQVFDDTLANSTDPLSDIDIENTHRDDFVKYLAQYITDEDERKKQLEKFIRTKRIYKREKAKKRFALRSVIFENGEVKSSQNQLVKQDNGIEDQKSTSQEESVDRQEDQRRKKRISAQVSRDRKKMYIEALQEENFRLKKKCQKLEQENENLKTANQLTEAKKSAPYSIKKFAQKHGSLKSLFIMSLVLLTSVNKHVETTQHQLAIAKESLFQSANVLVNEYCTQQYKLPVPQFEDFKRDLKVQQLKVQESKVQELVYCQSSLEFRPEESGSVSLKSPEIITMRNLGKRAASSASKKKWQAVGY